MFETNCLNINLFYFGLSGVVYFNHHYGCQRCYVRGVYDKVARRMCFPKFDEPLRTDKEFREKSQSIHHKETSILESLEMPDGSPLLNMISQFPTSDPLHLLEEGVMKKCIKMWLSGKGPRTKKWSKETISNLNKNILQWNREFPNDINRKLRSLDYLSHYKATEFRSMLLYIGIVAFKGILEEQQYVHFLTLSMGIRFFSCKYYVQNGNLKAIARRLLNEYCENFPKIYNVNQIVSNIHNICHIADDVDNFGDLNQISTYPFENFLHEIKLRVKPSNNPMPQITRRLIEESLNKPNSQINFVTRKFERASWVPEMKYEFGGANKSASTVSPVYQFIRVKPNVFFSAKKFGDKWFITKTGDIVEMKYAIKKANSYYIFGAPVKNKTDFFTVPFHSQKSDIYLSDCKTDQAKLFKYDEIKAKMMCLSYSENYVFIPLLHSFDDCMNI